MKYLSRDKEAALSLEYAWSVLDYNPESGVFTYKPRNGLTEGQRTGFARFVGQRAGSRHPAGYRLIKLQFPDGRKIAYFEHRLAYFMMTGDWPAEDIDHINRVKHDNRWANLRAVQHMENGWNMDRNNEHPGIDWVKKDQAWRARFTSRALKRVVSKNFSPSKFNGVASALEAAIQWRAAELACLMRSE